MQKNIEGKTTNQLILSARQRQKMSPIDRGLIAQMNNNDILGKDSSNCLKFDELLKEAQKLSHLITVD